MSKLNTTTNLVDIGIGEYWFSGRVYHMADDKGHKAKRVATVSCDLDSVEATMVLTDPSRKIRRYEEGLDLQDALIIASDFLSEV